MVIVENSRKLFDFIQMASFRAPMLSANPKASDWNYFLRLFENYLVISSATEQQKLPLLLNCLGRDGLGIYDGLPTPKSSFREAADRFSASTSAVVLLYFYTAKLSTLQHRACRKRPLNLLVS